MKWKIFAEIKVDEGEVFLNITPNPISLSYTIETNITDSEELESLLNDQSHIAVSTSISNQIILKTNLYSLPEQELVLNHDESLCEASFYNNDTLDFLNYVEANLFAFVVFSVEPEEESSSEE